jgi:hypothetical protein
VRNVRAGMAVVLVALGLGQTPQVLAEASPGQGVDKAQAREAPRSQRLRFRSGPVCMCANGLGEKEIEAAERRRLESIVEPQDGKRR